MSGDFQGNADEIIPANVRMISGCQDSQTSADVGNVSTFQLPDPAGRAGGACTSALLKVLYESKGLSFVQVLTRMRGILGKGSYTQIPQLSSSRKMDVNDPFEITPSGSSGTKRAILIGINYVGQQGQLSGCHNDVGNIKDYLVKQEGFNESNITILMDDGNHQSPTYENIIGAFRHLVNSSETGDCAFFHYSGHGGRLPDEHKEEEDGYDETLIPVDYQSAGQIRDDTVFAELVGRMPEGTTLTCLMDCCHSGSVLDLPYIFKADGQQQEMGSNPKAKLGKLQSMAIAYMIAKIFGTGVVAQIASVVLATALGGGGGSGGRQSLSLLSKLMTMVCK